MGREHGKIAAGAWLLLRTDWSKRTDPAEFLNIKEDGPHSPGFTADCVQFLTHERDVLGVGVETVGTDAGKFGLASLCNLDQLPPVGSIIITAPLKIIDGSGSPLRVLALVPS